MELSTLNGANGLVINGEEASDCSGITVAPGVDLNGDGISDLLIGTFTKDSSTGKVYAIFGGPSLEANGVLDLTSLDGKSGFRLRGAIFNGGARNNPLANAGDVNSDGITDLMIGAHGATE